ncbi:MAG: hypothetical protein RLZZ399_1349 [Verrucomicrobiota bacterium]|jgi:outer membrane protein assembly factor BamB
MRFLNTLGLMLGGAFLFSSSSLAGDWPRFLGPNHDSKVDPADAQGFWPEGGLRKQWEFPKGKGWACPAVVENKVFVFHRVGSREILDCLEASSGRVLWNFGYEAPYRDRFGGGDGPRTSPVVYGSSVSVFGVTGRLHCLDVESGRVVWERDLAKEYGMAENFFGHGSTPLWVGGSLIVPVGGSGNRCVVALDGASGSERWVTSHEWGAGYASAVPARIAIGGELRDLALVFTGGESRPPTGGLLCIDASNGKLLGQVSHRAKIAESVNAASPVVMGRRVFTTEGYGSGGILSEIGEDGALRVVWRTSKLGSQFATPVGRDGLILGFDGQSSQLAELVCLDAGTGEEKWREDFGGRFGRGSLVDLGAGGLVALGEFGELVRMRIRPEGAEVLQRTRVFEAPESWTVPVIAGRRLYLSQNERGRDGSSPRVICYKFEAAK